MLDPKEIELLDQIATNRADLTRAQTDLANQQNQVKLYTNTMEASKHRRDGLIKDIDDLKIKLATYIAGRYVGDLAQSNKLKLDSVDEQLVSSREA